MVRALGEVLGPDDRVLVIDDNSPDGTGELADRLAAELEAVEVLHRPHKEGLGPAYLAGFRRALELGAELVVEIDCDFSHDPADVPRLLAAAEDADLVLGSRYVPGGSVENWGAVRRAISSGGSLYARLLLGVPVRDLTGGFKCFRRAVLETIDLDAIHSQGLRLPDRADLSRAAPRLPRPRGADPLRRPRGRRLEDVALDRARGDLEGAAPAPRGARRQAVREVTDATFEDEVRQGRRPDDRRLLGAVVQAVQGDRADPGGARRRPRARPRAAEHRRAHRRALALRRPLAADRDPVRRAASPGRPSSAPARGATSSAPSRTGSPPKPIRGSSSG